MAKFNISINGVTPATITFIEMMEMLNSRFDGPDRTVDAPRSHIRKYILEQETIIMIKVCMLQLEEIVSIHILKDGRECGYVDAHFYTTTKMIHVDHQICEFGKEFLESAQRTISDAIWHW